MNTKRILLVEDEPLIINAYTQWLTREGYIIETAHDGKDGLQKAKGGSFDLILLDLILPKLDGFEFLERYRHHDAPSPVVVLSNLGQESDIARARELGAVDYLVKANHSLDSLGEKLQTYLG